MANEYAVNQADLVAVAEAIRAKGGTSGALTFPGGFVDAVGAIQAGGGGEDVDKVLEGFISGSIARDITYTGVNVRGAMFSGLSSMSNNVINLPNLVITQASLFANSKIGQIIAPKVEECYASTFNSTVINEIDLPALEKAAGQLFRSCTAHTVNVPNLKTITAQGTFAFMVNLEEIELPSLVTGQNLLFEGCTALKKVDFGSDYSAMGAMVFQNCNNGPEAIILRSTTVVSLSNVNAFTNTPFTGYGGTYSGHIYVPSALISAYQAATNWATLYAAYPNIFQPIEGSEYE